MRGETSIMPLDFDAFVAGWIGGASSTIASHPLDTIKVRLQTSTSYKGTTDCMRKTFKQEGIRGFYKGMAFPLVCSSAYNSLVFGSFQQFQQLICQLRYSDNNHQPSFADQCIAAMGTGAVSVLLGAPVDLVKIRLQVQTNPQTSTRRLISAVPTKSVAIGTKTAAYSTSAKPILAKQYRGPIDCLVDIYKSGGVRGMYRGAACMLIRDIPGYTIYLVPYCMLRTEFVNRAGDSAMAELVACALAGGLAGVLSWGIMHPVDTVKSRLQADSVNKYHGVIHCTKRIYAEHGLSAFFRGLTMNALRGFPQSAALFCGVEITTKLFEKSRGVTKY